METKNTKLTAALAYEARGWSVIPLSPEGDKKRSLVAWLGFQTKGADEAQIREWWGKWPDAGIAIITGKVSNLIVCDIDSSELSRADNSFTRTLMATTPRGGLHLYYIYDEDVSGGLKCGADVRSDGAYVVAPSDMSSGRHWVGGGSGEPMGAIASEIESLLKDVK